jgi:hypothetical protein
MSMMTTEVDMLCKRGMRYYHSYGVCIEVGEMQRTA